MWIITYTIDYNYRDRDGYHACDNGEVETVEDDTLKDALSTFIRHEATQSLICDYANASSYDAYYSINVISCYQVTKSVDIAFENIPVVRNMIVDKKTSNIKKRLRDDKKKKRDEKARELDTLRKLKEKYEGNNYG